MNAGNSKNYRCSKCGRGGAKLWRQYQTVVEKIKLLCGKCACEDQGIEYSIRADGTIVGEYGITDQIKWLVPAIPAGPNTFWGYSSVPEDGVKWWRELPL